MDYITFLIAFTISYVISSVVMFVSVFYILDRANKKREKQRQIELAEIIKFKQCLKKQNSLLYDICAQTQALVEKLAPEAIMDDSFYGVYRNYGESFNDDSYTGYTNIDCGGGFEPDINLNDYGLYGKRVFEKLNKMHCFGKQPVVIEQDPIPLNKKKIKE